jgi:flagellar protein FliJ
MQSLLSLLHHAQDERDRALSAWQLANNAKLAIEAQYEQLLLYRREYEERWSRQFSEHGQMELVRSYHGFMQRLTQALEHQQGTVKNSALRADKARTLLRERELRVASVRKLIERRQQQLHVDAGRREQKLNDELASRRVHDSAFQDMTSVF